MITGGIQTIQKLQGSRSIVFDKTGTLTEASLSVENMAVAPQWVEQKDLLWQCICVVEEDAAASHPIARAIFSSGLQQLGPLWPTTQSARSCRFLTRDTGLGISGQVRLGDDIWRHIRVGSAKYFRQSGSQEIPEKAQLPLYGMISVHVAIDLKYAGTLYLGVSELDVS